MAFVVIDLYGDSDDGLVTETKEQNAKKPQPKTPPKRDLEPGLQIVPAVPSQR